MSEMKLYGRGMWRNTPQNHQMQHLPPPSIDAYSYNYWYTYPNAIPGLTYQPPPNNPKDKQNRVERKKKIRNDLLFTVRYRPPKLTLRQMVRYTQIFLKICLLAYSTIRPHLYFKLDLVPTEQYKAVLSSGYGQIPIYIWRLIWVKRPDSQNAVSKL